MLCEQLWGLWHLYLFLMQEHTPPIIHLQVHLPDQQPIIFEEDEDGNIQDLVDTNPDHDTTLTAWFKANAELADNCNLLYRDFPSKMVWNKKTYKWTTRKKGVSAIGRMYHTHPTSGEWFYLCLLQGGLHCTWPFRRWPWMAPMLGWGKEYADRFATVPLICYHPSWLHSCMPVMTSDIIFSAMQIWKIPQMHRFKTMISTWLTSSFLTLGRGLRSGLACHRFRRTGGRCLGIAWSWNSGSTTLKDWPNLLQSILQLSPRINLLHLRRSPLQSALSTGSVLHSSGMFCLTWAGWLWLWCFAHCTWSLRFRYSVRAADSWAYGWYRVARVWEISQVYKVFKGESVCSALQD